MGKNSTKIGDVFSVKINQDTQKYFQLIAFDLTQLNSDVIRAFQKEYPINRKPDFSEIIKDTVDFHAHCVVNIGLKMKLWEKIGNKNEIGNIKEILFRDTNDYSINNINISNNWYIWHINDEKFTHVGKLEGKNRNAEIGIVINPLGIIELLKGNKYPINYPRFE